MFMRSVNRNLLRTRAAGSRGKATTATTSPAGDAEKNQGFRIWVREQVGMWPVIAVTLLTVGAGIWVMNNNLAAPFWKTNHQERRTIDYLENNKDEKKALKWRNSALQAGPEIVHKLNPYPTTSDYKVDASAPPTTERK